MRRTPVRLLHAAAVLLAIHLGCRAPAAGESDWTTGVKLAWQPHQGVVLETPVATVRLDGGVEAGGPLLRFAGENLPRRLSAPKVEQADEHNLVLRYRIAGPDGNFLEATPPHCGCRTAQGEAELVEEFTLTPAKTIHTDLEIQRPFSLHVVGGVRETHQTHPAAAAPDETPLRSTHPTQAALPLYNGWARTFPLASDVLRGEWQLGNMMTDVPSHQLGLPVVQFGQEGRWLGAVCADPYFGSLYELSARDGQIIGSVRYRYAASKVPLAAGRTEVRHFGLWLAAAKPGEPFGRSVDAFFRLMLPDVPPGPEWLHEIAMVGFDFLSDGGQGWEKDVAELARLLTPAERHRVALCFHGWYENARRLQLRCRQEGDEAGVGGDGPHPQGPFHPGRDAAAG